ncbi:cAMP-binding protein - catabolite gene activator and regulatory subunit of cAMP-dependent protein kinase [alpha proteobacterium BAL199]|nr:cAMP-binding protein - catabolite gene activator and regulatory subunit of cAMP-dependent protein kinase [alpha proteobacterium BAL199]
MKNTKVLDRRVYRTGQFIFREGEQSWAAFLIERGSVDIVKNAESTAPTCLATIKAGDMFGEMGLIDGSPRSATAQAAEPTVVQVINEREFHRLLTAAEPVWWPSCGSSCGACAPPTMPWSVSLATIARCRCRPGSVPQRCRGTAIGRP